MVRLRGLQLPALTEAAEYTLGTAPGTRDWPGADRLRRAAGVYGVSAERFRKYQEGVVLGQIAEQIVRLAGEVPPAETPGLCRRPGFAQIAPESRLDRLLVWKIRPG
ncbi:hypothetical protein ACFVTT_08255 [Streptomyces niveus]|uniref:hypothetical protein n=1 Tax=Streptomyces niveus TaxID=193462 RepID=UPI0034287D79